MKDRYRPLSVKKQVLVVVLALLTASTVMLSMLYRPGSPPPPRAVAPDAARCAPGQTTDCVGGIAAVIALPASAAPHKAP